MDWSKRLGDDCDRSMTRGKLLNFYFLINVFRLKSRYDWNKLEIE